MSFSGFELFCADVCAAAQCEAPALDCDDNGIVAFNLQVLETRISFVYAQRTAPEKVFAIVEFGSVPAADAEKAWQILMEANLYMLQEDAPAFARNPANGEVLLRISAPLAGVQPLALYQRLVGLVHVARRWRLDPLAGSVASATGLAPMGMLA